MFGDAGGVVAHEAESGDLESAGVGEHRLRHGRHADEIGSEKPVGADLRRRFVGGAGSEDVDARRQRVPRLATGREQQLDQPGIVDMGLVGEPRSERRIVRPPEGIEVVHADVVADGHHVAGLQVRTDAAGGVGDEQHGAAETAGDLDRHDDGLPRGAFIPVTAAAEGKRQSASGRAHKQQPSGMADDGDVAEMRNRAVGDFREHVQPLDRTAPAGAEHQGAGGLGAPDAFGKRGEGLIENLRVHFSSPARACAPSCPSWT